MNDLLTDLMLTEKQVCDFLQISRYTLYRARMNGTLREWMQLGRRGTVRYSLRELRQVYLVSDEKLFKFYTAREKAKRKARHEQRKQAVTNVNEGRV